jgi:hypothetical protein
MDTTREKTPNQGTLNKGSFVIPQNYFSLLNNKLRLKSVSYTR